MPLFFKTGLVFAMFTLISNSAIARRKVGAHEHGVGRLGIACEGSKIQVNLKLPAHDVIGSESHAKTKEEEAKHHAALDKLKQSFPQAFVLPAELGCRFVKSSVWHDEDVAHEDEHVHEKAKKHHHEKMKKPEKHKHHDNRGKHEESHSDVDAEFTIACTSPVAGKEVIVDFSKILPSVKKLGLQVACSDVKAPVSIESFPTKVKL